MRIKERGCHERTAFAIGNISRVVCAERLDVTQVRRQDVTVGKLCGGFAHKSRTGRR
jgi:hypothetical protein